MAARLILLWCLLPHDVNEKRILTIFVVMSGWFLLASAIVRYQRKLKLLKLKLKKLGKFTCTLWQQKAIDSSLRRLVFSRFLDLRVNLGIAKEKPTRKTFFSREKKHLAPRIYQAKFCLSTFL